MSLVAALLRSLWTRRTCLRWRRVLICPSCLGTGLGPTMLVVGRTWCERCQGNGYLG